MPNGDIDCGFRARNLGMLQSSLQAPIRTKNQPGARKSWPGVWKDCRTRLAILQTAWSAKSLPNGSLKKATRATRGELVAQEKRLRLAGCPDVRRLVLRLY